MVHTTNNWRRLPPRNVVRAWCRCGWEMWIVLLAHLCVCMSRWEVPGESQLNNFAYTLQKRIESDPICDILTKRGFWSREWMKTWRSVEKGRNFSQNLPARNGLNIGFVAVWSRCEIVNIFSTGEQFLNGNTFSSLNSQGWQGHRKKQLLAEIVQHCPTPCPGRA